MMGNENKSRQQTEGDPDQPADGDRAPLRDQQERAVRARAGDDGPLRRRVVDLYAAAARDFRRAPEVVARGLREARELGSTERRFVGDAVYELVRHRRRLETLTGKREALPLYLAWLAGRAEGPLEGAAPALVHSFADWMVERFTASFGPPDTERLLAALNRRAPLTVRANRLRGDRDALAARLAAEGIATTPTALAADGLRLHTRHNVYEQAALRDGSMEVQDEGSQLVAELTAPPPAGVVIDACAGAGGKTLAIAALLDGRGRVLALDTHRPRLEEAKRRSRRAGLNNVQVLLVDRSSPGPLPLADRVLVDAPCSGVGVIRRHPETKWHVEPRHVATLAVTQRAIVETYARLVKPGGRLIYATCSLFSEENDAIVDDFLAAHPEFTPVPAKELLGRPRALLLGDGERLRVAPHRHDSDGFFAAVLRRRA